MRKLAARALRWLAAKLDPEPAGQKRHHPALKNPGELKDFSQVKDVGSTSGANSNGWVSRDSAWGRWGGPYL